MHVCTHLLQESQTWNLFSVAVLQWNNGEYATLSMLLQPNCFCSQDIEAKPLAYELLYYQHTVSMVRVIPTSIHLPI